MDFGISDMFPNHDRSPDFFFQGSMSPNGESPVGIRILIPEQFMFIADTAYTDGVGEGFEMACSIIHDVHRSSDLLCHSPDHLGFPSFQPCIL